MSKGDVIDVSERPTFYTDAQKYWEGIGPTMTGMMGGLQQLSSPDLSASVQFFYPFHKGIQAKLKKGEKLRACDCGAGIGRVTKCLLAGFADEIDMVEQCQAFLDKSGSYLGDEAKKVSRKICSGLQAFEPEKDRYHVIWCQWVLSHLTDNDLVQFLNRCALSVNQNGVIIIKENICPQGKAEFDETDSSVCRTDKSFKLIFRQAGLKLISELKQPNFPDKLYPVKMYALKPQYVHEVVNFESNDDDEGS